MKRSKVADLPEAGGRWCAAHADARDCHGDRKAVSIDGTRFVLCRKARNELRARRAARTKAFKDANMSLAL